MRDDVLQYNDSTCSNPMDELFEEMFKHSDEVRTCIMRDRA